MTIKFDKKVCPLPHPGCSREVEIDEEQKTLMSDFFLSFCHFFLFEANERISPPPRFTHSLTEWVKVKAQDDGISLRRKMKLYIRFCLFYS